MNDKTTIDYIFILLPPTISAIVVLISNRVSFLNPKLDKIQEKQLHKIYLPLYISLKCEYSDIVTINILGLKYEPNVESSYVFDLNDSEITGLKLLVKKIIDEYYLYIPQTLLEFFRKILDKYDHSDLVAFRNYVISNYNYLKRQKGYPSNRGINAFKYLETETKQRLLSSYITKVLLIVSIIMAFLFFYEPTWNLHLIRILSFVLGMVVIGISMMVKIILKEKDNE